MKPIFVMIKCDLGAAYQVASELVEVEGVSEVYSISGQYDLLVKCYVGGDQDIGRFVNTSLHRISGVKDTFTIVTFNAFT